METFNPITIGLTKYLFFTGKGGGGTSLFFQMGVLSDAGEQAVHINGIPLLMDQEAEERTADVTIDYKEGQLVLDDPNASDCSSCG